MDQPPMTREELLDEAAWLLSFGVHPDRVAEQLRRSLAALTQAARRGGRPELAQIFERSRRRDWGQAA